MRNYRRLTKWERKVQDFQARLDALTDKDLVMLAAACVLFLFGVYAFVFFGVMT